MILTPSQFLAVGSRGLGFPCFPVGGGDRGVRQSQEDTPVCAEISLRRIGASLQGIWQSETEGSLDSWRWKAVRVPWVPVLRAVSPGDSEPEEGQKGEQG